MESSYLNFAFFVILLSTIYPGKPEAYEAGPSNNCPSDDWLDLGSDKCFLINKKTKSNWKTAAQKCSEAAPKSTLAVFHSKQEMDQLAPYATNNETNFWIGLSKSTVEWVDGQPNSFTHWAEGEPNNDVSERCVESYQFNMKWNDLSCDLRLGYICTMPKDDSAGCPSKEWVDVGLDKCYLIRRVKVTWVAALEACTLAASESTLAIFHSKVEIGLLLPHVQNDYTNFWIGIRKQMDTGHLQWVNSKSSNFSNWVSEEPSDEASEDCVQSSRFDLRWNDTSCDHELGHICTVQKQNKTCADFMNTDEEITWEAFCNELNRFCHTVGGDAPTKCGKCKRLFVNFSEQDDAACEEAKCSMGVTKLTGETTDVYCDRNNRTCILVYEEGNVYARCSTCKTHFKIDPSNNITCQAKTCEDYERSENQTWKSFCDNLNRNCETDQTRDPSKCGQCLENFHNSKTADNQAKCLVKTCSEYNQSEGKSWKSFCDNLNRECTAPNGQIPTTCGQCNFNHYDPTPEHDQAKCVETPWCPKMTQPANTIMTGRCQDSTPLDMCFIKCQEGFRATGGRHALECQGDGSWDRSPPTCEAQDAVSTEKYKETEDET